MIKAQPADARARDCLRRLMREPQFFLIDVANRSPARRPRGRSTPHMRPKGI